MTRTRHLLFALAALLAMAPASAQTDRGRFGRIRSTDARLLELVAEAVERSPTLRTLVRRIEASDVVVYLLCDDHPRAGIAGRLTFVSKAGGNRYLLVRLARLKYRSLQMAVLGHELQHAVEIADTPAIVDPPSLAREYERIGHINVRSSAQGIAFDSDADIVAGHLVLGEVEAMTGD